MDTGTTCPRKLRAIMANSVMVNEDKGKEASLWLSTTCNPQAVRSKQHHDDIHDHVRNQHGCQRTEARGDRACTGTGDRTRCRYAATGRELRVRRTGCWYACVALLGLAVLLLLLGRIVNPDCYVGRAVWLSRPQVTSPTDHHREYLYLEVYCGGLPGTAAGISAVADR